MHLSRLKLKAYPVYLLMVGTYSLAGAIMFTLNLVYQVEIVNLNPLQLVLVGTTLETSCFLSQIPTGVIADVYSRRLSVIIGFVLTGIGFLIEGLIPNFAFVLLGNIIWGIGATCIDGAQEAWVIDEVGEEHAGRIFTRGSQVSQVAGLLGIPISIALGSLRLNVPVVTGAILILFLGLLLPLIMTENNFVPTPREDRNSWQAMGRQFIEARRALQIKPMLISIFGAGLFIGLASEGFDRLNQIHFLQDFSLPTIWGLTPVIWFGIMSAGSSLLGIATTELVNRGLNMNRTRSLVRALTVIDSLLIVCVVGFALAGNFYLALLAFWGARVMRTAQQPLYSTWITQNADSRIRATIFSFAGMVDAIGQIGGGPIVGYIGERASIRAALTVTGLLMTPILFFFLRAFRLLNRENASKQEENLAEPVTELEI
ncbi:MFS transporter [Ktedonospora formicarum]|uniref:Tetracycline efflux MFS transporter TetA(P) n=1 Tax=Ktedonospora formicarum TaxID=2778364 RepID=A0A8J3I0C9_9CHLR|nr:MFS transporter [Ktedonospora formicarum]GHO44348.1 tetracycline efflux MFS transporter TetA(P) [Ktedonospora formicarum]